MEFFQKFSIESGIDREAGIIRNVCIATLGEVKGHDQFIDKKSLDQFLECANAYRGGVKVLLNHDGDIKDTVGFIREPRVQGEKLIGDLHLLQNSPHKGFVLEMAEKMSDTFGISTTFENKPEKIDGIKYTRCHELYSADLVTEPASNPSGLFERVDNSTKEKEDNEDMNPEEFSAMFQAAFAEAIKPVMEQCSKFSQFMDGSAKTEDKPAPVTEDKKETPEQLDARIRSIVEETTNAAVTKFSAALGTRTPAAVIPAAATVKEKFQDLVRKHLPENENSQLRTIKFCVGKYPEEHKAFIASGEKL